MGSWEVGRAAAATVAVAMATVATAVMTVARAARLVDAEELAAEAVRMRDRPPPRREPECTNSSVKRRTLSESASPRCRSSLRRTRQRNRAVARSPHCI